MARDKMLIRSNRVFTGRDGEVKPGWILVSDGLIVQVGKGETPEIVMDGETELVDAGEALVMPGLIDVHTFFMGWALTQIGLNLEGFQATEECVKAVSDYAAELSESRCIVAVGLPDGLDDEGRIVSLIEERVGSREVVVFGSGMETMYATASAVAAFDLDPERCYPEGYWKLLSAAMKWDEDLSVAFDAYQELMHSRGVTSVKEMTFDDSYGLVDFLRAREAAETLTLRVSVASQPVGHLQDLQWGAHCEDTLTGNHLQWWGYNLMTDGSISVGEADLLAEYEEGADGASAGQSPDYAALRNMVELVDDAGYGYSLHAQGDAAVRESIRIFEGCKKSPNGRLVNHHAITDLEMSTREDHARMASLGIVAEVYPQVPSLRETDEAIGLASRQVGDRASRYWDRAGMVEAGVTVACGTDFPLLTPSLPESAYYACILPSKIDRPPFVPGNALSVEQLMEAWTLGGATDLGLAGVVGILEPGAVADLTVFELDEERESLVESVAGGRVTATYVDGRCVWSAQ